MCLGGSSGINIAGAVRLARRTRARPYHRDDPCRLWHALSVEAFQPGVSAVENLPAPGGWSMRPKCGPFEKVA